MFNVLGCIEKSQSSKHAQYNTVLLAGEPYRAWFPNAVSDALPEINTNTSASARWETVTQVLKSGAELTIGQITPPAR